MLIDRDKVPRLADVCVRLPVQEDLLQLADWQGRECVFCYPRIEAGQPTVCSETCVGRIRLPGVLLYDADRIEQAASAEHDRDLYRALAGHLPDPSDPKVIRSGSVLMASGCMAGAARRSPVYKMAVDWKVALPAAPGPLALPMASGTSRHCRRLRQQRMLVTWAQWRILTSTSCAFR